MPGIQLAFKDAKRLIAGKPEPGRGAIGDEQRPGLFSQPGLNSAGLKIFGALKTRGLIIGCWNINPALPAAKNQDQEKREKTNPAKASLEFLAFQISTLVLDLIADQYSRQKIFKLKKPDWTGTGLTGECL